MPATFTDTPKYSLQFHLHLPLVKDPTNQIPFHPLHDMQLFDLHPDQLQCDSLDDFLSSESCMESSSSVFNTLTAV